VCERIQGIVSGMNRANPGDVLPIRATLTFASYPEKAGNIAELLLEVESGHPAYRREAAEQEAALAA